MDYLDAATVQLFYLVFTIILIVFISGIMLNIIADFFHKVFNLGRKKYGDKNDR
jgi:type IV secretory pathway VirB3-like protein